MVAVVCGSILEYFFTFAQTVILASQASHQSCDESLQVIATCRPTCNTGGSAFGPPIITTPYLQSFLHVRYSFVGRHTRQLRGASSCHRRPHLLVGVGGADGGRQGQQGHHAAARHRPGHVVVLGVVGVLGGLAALLALQGRRGAGRAAGPLRPVRRCDQVRPGARSLGVRGSGCALRTRGVRVLH